VTAENATILLRAAADIVCLTFAGAEAFVFAAANTGFDAVRWAIEILREIEDRFPDKTGSR
jgi:hypothetical protein